MQTIEPLLQRLNVPGSASEVQKDILELLQEQQNQLNSVSSMKYVDTEELQLRGFALERLKADEEGLTDVAVQIANANPESLALGHLALKAIIRVMRISAATSGKDG